MNEVNTITPEEHNIGPFNIKWNIEGYEDNTGNPIVKMSTPTLRFTFTSTLGKIDNERIIDSMRLRLKIAKLVGE